MRRIARIAEIDYTGKLNEHDKYIEILNLLEEKTEYIEIVVIYERESNELIDSIKEVIISKIKVSEWRGTFTVVKNNLYKIKSSKKLFDKLINYETFCKYHISENRGGLLGNYGFWIR